MRKPTLLLSALALLLILPALRGEEKVQPRAPNIVTHPRQPASVDLPAPVEDRLETFFRSLKARHTERAFRNFFKGTQFEKQTELADGFVQAADGAFKTFGAMTAHSRYEIRKYGTRIIRVTYITFLAHKQLRWQFLYSVLDDSGWKLINLNVDDLRLFWTDDPIPLNPPSSIQVQIEKFFISVQDKKVSDAFANLLKNTGLDDKPDWVAAFVQNVETALREFGPMSAYELYDNRLLGNEVRMLTYIMFLRDEPLRWQFYYRLRGHDDWILINLRLDDMLDETLLGK